MNKSRHWPQEWNTDPKVLLVNAGNDEGMSKIANDGCFPALGVLALGTYIQKNIPEIEVLCRDGQVVSNKKIMNLYDSENITFLGISVLSTSYQNALDLAYQSACYGIPAVFGNDHAAQTAEALLNAHPYIGAVVGSEYGEEALEMLVRDSIGEIIDLDSIPHLTSTSNQLIKGNPRIFDIKKKLSELSIINSKLNNTGSRTTALDIFPIVDRSLYPEDHWATYLKRYKEKFGHLHNDEITGVTTMNRARGCSRQGHLICKHCDMGLDIAFSSPEKFWEEVKTAHKQIAANVFYEVCDSFSSFGRFVKSVADTKPKDLGFDPNFFVYGQAIDLVRRPKMVEYFKKIGVFRVNIGLEAGSNTTLQHMKGKFDSVAINYTALKKLKAAGIHAYGSFVLGTEAETPETLTQTVNFVKKIVTEGLLQDLEVQPILPLPNNYYGRDLVIKGIISRREDWPKDLGSISRLYIDQCSGISYNQAIEAAVELREFAAMYGINFGSGVSNESTYQS